MFHYNKRMEENIYIAKTLAHPIFYVIDSNDKRQLITDIKLFSNQKDAKLWVERQKKKHSILSSSVRVLNKKHIKSYILNNNQTLDIILEVPGTIMNNFSPKNETFDIYYLSPESGLLSRAKVSKEVISKYSLTHR